MVDRLERLTNLVALLLNTTRPLTLDGIVAEIEGYPAEPEARRQAFERDKRVLRDEGVPLEVTPLPDGGSGYRISADEYYLTDLEFTDDELVALNLAVAAVHLEGGPGREVLWSLGDARAGDVPALAALPVIDALPALFDGYRRRAQVSFGYRGDTRALEPWGLLFRDGNWYVTGRDVDRDEERSFRADRISGKVTVGPPGTFTPPEGFDPRTVMPDQPFQIGGNAPTEVDIAVDADHAGRAIADVGEDAVVRREANGDVLLRISVTNPAGLRSWLLGFMDHARVVSPLDARTEVVSWLKKMAGRAR